MLLTVTIKDRQGNIWIVRQGRGYLYLSNLVQKITIFSHEFRGKKLYKVLDTLYSNAVYYSIAQMTDYVDTKFSDNVILNALILGGIK